MTDLVEGMREDHSLPKIVQGWRSVGAPHFADGFPSERFSQVTSATPQVATQTGSRQRVLTNRQAASNLALLLDALIILATSVLAGITYHSIALGQYGEIETFLGVGLLVATIYCAGVSVSESRDLAKISRRFARARGGVVAWGNAFLLFILLAFALKFGQSLSRGAMLSFFVLGLLTVPISRVYIPIILARYQRNSAYLRRSVILVGAAGDVGLARYAAELNLGGCRTPEVITFDANCSDGKWPEVRQIMIRQVLEAARRLGPGEIFVSVSQIDSNRAESILRGLSLVPRAVLLLPDNFTAAMLRNPIRALGDHVAVEIQREPLGFLGRAAKRGLDIVLACAALLLMAPIMLAIAAAVKLDSPGPVIFRQTRNGKGGRPFKILKFRSMSVLDDGPIVVQARKDDQRVTRVGRWLRKTSFDELPQLLNVLKGEMSLVGPRPHARAHDELYAKSVDNYEIRQHVKPGITGWAQIHGLRGETSSTELMFRRIEHDIWYAMNCGPLLDLQILVRTPFEVLRQRSAY